MDDRHIPYVMICHDYRDMDIKFRDVLVENIGMIAKERKADRRIEFKDGTILLFVTASRFYAPDNQWRQGRVYKIVGGGGQVYHGDFPVKMPKKEITVSPFDTRKE